MACDSVNTRKLDPFPDYTRDILRTSVRASSYPKDRRPYGRPQNPNLPTAHLPLPPGTYAQAAITLSCHITRIEKLLKP